MHTLPNGLLIALEGIDGTGKTTQLKMLAEALLSMGYDVVATREPTDGRYGQRIRQVLRDRSSVTSQEELELFLLDRKEHVTTIINPGLAAGKIVLTDRYYLSTVAYQGALGHNPDVILALNEAFAPPPDLAIVLVAPPLKGIERIRILRQERPDSFEKEGYLVQVAAIFNNLPQGYIRRIDALAAKEEVHGEIMVHVEKVLGTRRKAIVK